MSKGKAKAKVEEMPEEDWKNQQKVFAQIGDDFVNRYQFDLCTEYMIRDIGMLVGEIFTRNHKSLHWGYDSKPKKYVFKNETNTKKEFWTVFFSFYGARLATYFMEEAMFVVLCDILGINKTFITIVSQFVIFIANYILSKIFVFRKKDGEVGQNG